MKRKLNYYGADVPSGNKYEFPEIDAFLRDQKIDYQVYYYSSGFRIYKIHKKHIKKFPKIEGDYCLPIGEDDGYSLGKVGEEYPSIPGGICVEVTW